MRLVCSRCKEEAVVIHDNAPGSHEMTDIQKKLVQACAEKFIEFMMNELGMLNSHLLMSPVMHQSRRKWL